MSLKNYIFASINTKATSALHNRHQHHHVAGGHHIRNSSSGEEEPPDAEQTENRDTMSTIIEDIVEHPGHHTSANWVKKLWKFVSVEPVMVCWLLPSCLLYIAVENLALEKVSILIFSIDILNRSRI